MIKAPMHFGLILLVFVVIFIAELPDKSLFAALVMGTRFPARYVWLGGAAAFLVHVIFAVSFGALLTLLPHRLLEAVVALLFLAGACLIYFGKHGLEDKPEPHLTTRAAHNPWRVFATAFSVVFTGEWGDITQIATANYAAKYHDPWSVAVGATLALWLVCGLAVLAGNKILKTISPVVLQRITVLILLGFAIYSAYGVFK